MAGFPDALLDDVAHRSARVVARALLADAAAQRERLGNSDDAEALHDFRVAVRRLRSWVRAERRVLEGSVPKRARRRLRRVAQATSASRDAQVFSGWIAEVRATLNARQRVGAGWMLDRLARSRSEAESGVAGSLERDFEPARRALEERLPLFRLVYHVDDGPRAPTFAAGMAALVATYGATLRRRLSAIHDHLDHDVIHRARMAGKRLRYVLEPVARHLPAGEHAVSELKRLQDALGGLHDAHVWLELLRTALVDAGTERVTQLATAAGTGVSVRRGAAGPGARRDPRSGLLALAERVRVRSESTYEALRAEWLSGEPPALFAHVEQVVAALDARGRSGVEIERKYLLSRLPTEHPAGFEQRIDQGYVPGDRLIERLRRIERDEEVRYVRTVKVGSGIARTELEEPCSREVFEAMWPLTRHRRVAKRRHVVADGGYVWELDEFLDRDLALAEVELSSAAVVPEIPPWLAPYVVREVTGEAEYVNANLAR